MGKINTTKIEIATSRSISKHVFEQRSKQSQKQKTTGCSISETNPCVLAFHIADEKFYINEFMVPLIIPSTDKYLWGIPMTYLLLVV